MSGFSIQGLRGPTHGAIVAGMVLAAMTAGASAHSQILSARPRNSGSTGAAEGPALAIVYLGAVEWSHPELSGASIHIGRALLATAVVVEAPRSRSAASVPPWSRIHDDEHWTSDVVAATCWGHGWEASSRGVEHSAEDGSG